MDDGLLWLPDHIRDQRRTPEIPKGTFTVFTHRPDGAFAPTSGIFSAEQTASLRAELSVPACWVLETLFYDLRGFGDDLKGYRAVIHGVRVLHRDLFTAPSGQVGQLYSLNGGDLEVAPGGTVPLYPCFTLIDEQSRSVVLGIPDNAEELRAAGRLILHFVLLTLSIRIRYQGSSIFAERRWHPDFIRETEHIGGLEVSKDAREVNRARQDFTLIDDLRKLRPKGGRPEVDRNVRLERLARAGLRWLKGHPYHAVEDVGRPELAEAMGEDSTRPISKLMERQPHIVNADVHRRIHELLDNADSEVFGGFPGDAKRTGRPYAQRDGRE